MKTTLLSLLLLFLIIAGCGDDEPTSPANEKFIISGKIENWNLGANKTIKIFDVHTAKKYGSAAVAEDGSFTLEPPTPEYITFLYNVVYVFGCSDTIRFAPDDARGCKGVLRIYDGDVQINNVKMGYNGDSLCTSYLIHSDKDVAVTGAMTCELETPFPSQESFNLNLKKGWNFYYVLEKTVNAVHITKSTTVRPANAKFMLVY